MKRLWLPFRRKPRRPYLNRHPLRIPGAAASSGIRQQIAEPPCSAAVRQPQANKPDFITAPDRQCGEHFIQSGQDFLSPGNTKLSHRTFADPVTAVTADVLGNEP